MSTFEHGVFWLIDDGRDTDTLLSWGKRFNSEEAANAERTTRQGLLRVSEILTPGGRLTEVQS